MTDISEIKTNSTIEEVFAKLGLLGKSTSAFQCPFHDKHAHNDKNASCVFWKDHKGIKCFGCGYNANLFDFVKDYLNLDIKDTVNWFKEHFNLTDIDKGNDVAQLANRLNISEEALSLAIKDNYLKFYSKRGIRYLSISEESPLNVTQERRMDGQMIEFENGTTAKCRTFGSPSCPIGIKNLKENISLCEGGTDFLAAYQLMLAENLEKYFSPVCILGANNHINEQCLSYFKDKNILVFPDYDKAGINGCHNWETQLKPMCKAFYVYDFKGLKIDQETPVKDLRDFVQINGDDFEEDREVRYPLSCFLELLGNNEVPSNRLKASIEQHSLWEGDTITIESPSEVIEEEASMEAFPVEALPQDMQDYIHEICRIRSVDTTMVAPQVFGTIGGLVGKNVDVCTTEGDEYLRLNTYTFISACTGIGKSRSSQCIQSQLRPLEDRLLHLKRKLLVEDITSEQLIVRLQANNECAFVYSSDGRQICNNILGAYRKNGTDEGIYLKGYSGDMHDTERKMDNLNIRLNSPRINIVVLVQPEKVYELFENKRLYESGLLERCFFISVPTEKHLRDTKKITVNQDVLAIGKKHFSELFNAFYLSDYVHHIQLTDEAYERIITFQNERTGYDEFANRYPEFLIKLTGQLHVWRYLSESDKHPITLSEVENSLKILQWCIGQQSYFTGYVKEQKLTSSKQKLVNFLKHHGGRCPRSEITHNSHIEAKTLDDLLKIYPRSFKEQTRPQANGYTYHEVQLLSY